MQYSKKILDHFFKPKNVGLFPSHEPGIGRSIVGNYENGAIIHFQVKIKKSRILTAKFKAYGSCTIIAACSYATEWVKNKTIEEANQFSSLELMRELAIPEIKIHSALLVEDALKAAIAQLFPLKNQRE